MLIKYIIGNSLQVARGPIISPIPLLLIKIEKTGGSYFPMCSPFGVYKNAGPMPVVS